MTDTIRSSSADTARWCEELTRDGRQCSRGAREYVGGKLLCFQHARYVKDDSAAAFAEADERSLQEIRDAYPGGKGTHWSVRLRWTLLEALKRHDSPLWGKGTCLVCGKMSRRRTLTTNPLDLQRSYVSLCNRRKCGIAVRTWEGKANVRRRRAQYDWERQNPEIAPLTLIGSMPPQYPSVSRATLRAFLDSDADVATVDAGKWTAAALNGSIRSLGFGGQVFAELRSGQAVLRRPPGQPSGGAS